MKSIEDVLEEQKNYAAWRMLRNEKFEWSTFWENRRQSDDYNLLLTMPTISRISGETKYAPEARLNPLPTGAGFYHGYFGSTDSLLHYLLHDFSWRALPNSPAFPYSVDNPVVNRPDYKSELFCLITNYYAQGGKTKFKLWSLNPETKDVMYTDTIPLLVSLGLQ